MGTGRGRFSSCGSALVPPQGWGGHPGGGGAPQELQNDNINRLLEKRRLSGCSSHFLQRLGGGGGLPRASISPASHRKGGAGLREKATLQTFMIDPHHGSGGEGAVGQAGVWRGECLTRVQPGEHPKRVSTRGQRHGGDWRAHEDTHARPICSVVRSGHCPLNSALHCFPVMGERLPFPDTGREAGSQSVPRLWGGGSPGATLTP